MKRVPETVVAALVTFAGMLDAFTQPAIVVQPQTQEVPLGGTATFWVKSTGVEPLTYQWFLNSLANPVAGATNAALTVRNATNANAGVYLVRVTNAEGSALGAPARLKLLSGELPIFGTVTLPPAFQLNGTGTDVDSIAFWETPEPTNVLMIVTAKGNNLLEVWKYPFQGNQITSRVFSANVNGVVVDQETDRLYVSDRVVSVLALPGLQLVDEFGEGIIGVGENNLDLLKHTNGQTQIYVSDDHNVHRFVAGSWAYLGLFAPPVESIETIVADDFYQMILVPDEQGALGNPGVYAYHPDGSPFSRNGTNLFGGTGVFDSDEEGILLYTFPSHGLSDNGAGFYVVADQRSDVTDFEFFDRKTWSHLGRLRLTGVSNTDGIASTQLAMPGYPLGLFAAINNDTATAVLGWDVIFQGIGIRPGPRVLTISPASTGPTNAGVMDFTVAFSRPVTNFNDTADLVLTHFGTTHTNAAISGTGAVYTVTVSGIGGRGFFMLAVNTNSDLVDLETNALVSSVTSEPVFIDTPYGLWAAASGLVAGVNDGSDDDPDADGCLNIKEFAIDGDPLSADDNGKQRMRIEEVGGADYFTYTLPIRDGAVFVSAGGELSATADGVVYSLAGAFDLIEFDDPVVEQVPASAAGLPAPGPGWSYRTFRLDRPITSETNGFIRFLAREAQ